MIKRILISLALALTIVSAGCGASIGASSGEYRVSKVLDGDTIELSNGKIVRYIGIDTPETRKKVAGKWQLAPEPYAIEAKNYNESLVSRKNVRLEFEGDKEDKYGRWLAYVFVGKKMVNEEILKAGFGTIYLFPKNRKYEERLVLARNEARASREGLWNTCITLSSNETPNYINNVCVVQGQVLDTHRSKDAVFLGFGRSGTDFTAIIFAGNLVFFEKDGIIPARDYKGKYVEIVGKIRDYNGTSEIIISHPAQIKVIE